MDHMNQSLDKMEKKALDNQGSQAQAHQEVHLKPRKFPKKQYQKAGRRIWLTLISIIVIVVLILLGLGHLGSQPTHHVTHKSSKVTKTCHPHKAMEKQPRQTQESSPRITAKHGEKLLGKMLIHLHYTPIQTQRILNIYQRSNVNQENAIGQHLSDLTKNQQSQNQIQKYIHQTFLSHN